MVIIVFFLCNGIGMVYMYYSAFMNQHQKKRIYREFLEHQGWGWGGIVGQHSLKHHYTLKQKENQVITNDRAGRKLGIENFGSISSFNLKWSLDFLFFLPFRLEPSQNYLGHWVKMQHLMASIFERWVCCSALQFQKCSVFCHWASTDMSRNDFWLPKYCIMRIWGIVMKVRGMLRKRKIEGGHKGKVNNTNSFLWNNVFPFN